MGYLFKHTEPGRAAAVFSADTFGEVHLKSPVVRQIFALRVGLIALTLSATCSASC